MGLSDSARYEIDFRLKLKERDYEDAVLAAHDVSFDAVADDGLVIGGQPVQLSLTALNHGATEVNVTGVAIAGFDSPAACSPGAARKDAVYTCSAEAHIPKDAKLTTPYFSDNYWKHPENQAIQIFDPSVPFGVPFAPSPFRVTFHIKAGSVEVTKELPVEYRYVKDIYFGDKRMELNVVPAFLGAGHSDAGRDSRRGRHSESRRTRDPRHRDQRNQRRGQGDSGAGTAAGLEGHAGQRAAQLRARR